MKQCFEIISKETGKIESIWYELNKYQVRVINEKNKIIFDSNNYLKTKGDDNNQEKQEEVQG